ncbi:nitroreductase family protein [Maridesulfovibrio hydrothermalis]|uniref:Nitroreductase n=1 Tax=Maridesulfovibrio hydrothermalis AM13 = DSM 14728 TaxID=1121451 RepID=L0RCG0_9BACT|nr:nitroreductase family protein [Maridesulfovibrio hydrothermalis]CCO24419.1 Nitroreductase [Maridesulfovibrio hydrothermalis AM13 = DSM 14728]
MLNFTVDKELCVLCGLCAKDCVFGIIELDDYPQIKNEKKCIKCQHCLAVCPTGALSIMGNTAEGSTPLKGNLPEADQVEVLLKGRRSVRTYKEEPLEAATIEKLMEIAWHAPTGVNSQSVLVTLMDDPADVKKFSDEIYHRLEEGIEAGSLPETDLAHYIKWAYRMKKDTGMDMIFRGAPHFIFVSSPADAPSPTADTHIFMSYFEIMAQSMGVGTLWNGFLKYTVDFIFPDLREKLGIPENHQVGYAMIFGRPAVKYQRTVNRGAANVNRVTWQG